MSSPPSNGPNPSSSDAADPPDHLSSDTERDPQTSSRDAIDDRPDESASASIEEANDAGDADDSDGREPATLGALQEPQRLHPLTLLQRFLASLPALVLLLLPVLMNPSSENVFYLFMTAAFGLIALPSILLQYYRFSYRLTEKQIIIQSGVFNRQHRSIPIERVQNVQIEQNLLARIADIAKVKIETAGSSGTEGVLEYVSLKEAHRIRHAIRSFQRETVGETAPMVTPDIDTEDGAGEVAAEEISDEAEILFQMPLQRVLLSGMFRFSLIYIAVVFSVFQFFEPDTLLNYVLASRSQFQAIVDAVYASPFFAAVMTVMFAALFGWLTGIAINLNRYYGFHLWLEGDKLRKRHGLFTVTEGTIPLKKVQALILHTNPLMEAFGWFALEAQTIGLNVDEQGHRVIVPFAQLDQVRQIGKRVRDFDLQEPFERVSPLTIRRSFVRYLVGLSVIVVPAAYFWPPDWLAPMGVALPYWAYALTPLLLLWAYLQYTHHGYAVDDEALYVRRGVIGRYIWILPTEKHHVFYTRASVFQRRLGLKSFFVDTAGAASFAYPEVIDVPENTADKALDQLDDQFHTLYENRIRAATGSADTRLSADERPQLPDDAHSTWADE
ncbi:hypothetical protein CRI94_06120 [Longibacter salinarum]|uniref:YdbS-like PH domain-containing protein n=1 Tax=Longibacter salinarum TaxID=1850348 RepID=A0A2A8D0Z1_9BACT|nr:PH domain-containing protein [Longibacter salinarum]PEN14595.1 hypothetical protein CRI94_06120 [Longibacter salinarum]